MSYMQVFDGSCPTFTSSILKKHHHHNSWQTKRVQTLFAPATSSARHFGSASYTTSASSFCQISSLYQANSRAQRPYELPC